MLLAVLFLITALGTLGMALAYLTVLTLQPPAAAKPPAASQASQRRPRPATERRTSASDSAAASATRRPPGSLFAILPAGEHHQRHDRRQPHPLRPCEAPPVLAGSVPAPPVPAPTRPLAGLPRKRIARSCFRPVRSALMPRSQLPAADCDAFSPQPAWHDV